MARRVLMEEVSGWRARGRPRLGWMDGVKVALGNRGMTVEAARQWVKDLKEISLSYSCGYHLEKGEIPLHAAVGINSKKGATTENEGSDIKYMGRGVYVDDCLCVCVLFDLT